MRLSLVSCRNQVLFKKEIVNQLKPIYALYQLSEPYEPVYVSYIPVEGTGSIVIIEFWLTEIPPACLASRKSL